MFVRLSLVMLALAGAAGAAWGQDGPVARSYGEAPPPTNPAVTAAAQATPPAAKSDGDPTTAQIDAWLKADAQPVQTIGEQDFSSAPQQRRIHGEVGATISNRGYGGYAAASMPIGQASQLNVAVAGEHLHTRWGSANPKSIAVGLYLDGGDVAHWLSRDKCNVPRWGVALKDDPQVLPDGSCIKAAKADRTAAPTPGP